MVEVRRTFTNHLVRPLVTGRDIFHWHHRIVCAGRDLQGSQSPPLLQWGGTYSTRSGYSQSCYTWPWTLPGGCIHKLSGQSVPVTHCTLHRKYLLYAQFKFSLFQFKIVPSSPVTADLDKKSLYTFLLYLCIERPQ